MAESIVEFLEMIGVDHQQRQRCLRTGGKQPLFLEVIVQGTAVGNVGESVECCQRGRTSQRVPQLLVHPPLLEEQDGDGQKADQVKSQVKLNGQVARHSQRGRVRKGTVPVLGKKDRQDTCTTQRD